jgi:hypothetical protein
MPLWLIVPVVAALWLSSWIAGLDPTGNLSDATVVWSATVMATMLLVFRLARAR